MLWHIEGTETFLLATVHVSDMNPLWLPTETRRVLERSTRLIFEHDLDGQPNLSVLMLPKGVRLGDLVSESVFKAAASHWRQLGLAPKEMFAVMPGRVAQILSMTTADRAGLKGQYGIDRHLWNQSGNMGKSKELLEDFAGVIDAMAAIPMPEQVPALAETVGKHDLGLSEVRSLLTAWMLNDVAHLERLLVDRTIKYPVMMEKIITSRNESWLSFIVATARSGTPSLIAVGALHLVGPTGIPALLEERGFSVTLRPNR